MKLALIITIAVAFAFLANASQMFNVPTMSQKDSRWGSTQLGSGSYTISKKGCYLTCVTSIIASQGIKVNGQTPDPGLMNSWFKANKGFDGGLLLHKAAEKFGFKYEGKVTSKSDVIKAMDQGKFALLHVENLSHYVIAIGYDSNGYTIMDPAMVETSYRYSEVPETQIFSAPNNPNPAVIGSSSSSSSSSPSSSSQSTPTPTTTPAEPTPEPETSSSSENSDNSDDSSSENSSSENSNDNLIKESLNAHNEWRSDVGVPDLVWNKTLAANAQAWADQIARTKRTSHSNTRNGENIGYGSTRSNTITRFVDTWGAESDDFRSGRAYPRCTRGSESDIWHYTQMVWKKTTQVGCGISERDGRSYYVCQYYPKGNNDGEYVF